MDDAHKCSTIHSYTQVIECAQDCTELSLEAISGGLALSPFSIFTEEHMLNCE